MMAVGAVWTGVSVVNGLLRQDHPNQWFTTGGYVIGGALLGGGLLLATLTGKYYKLGGKFKLIYLQITPDKPATPGKSTTPGNPAPGNPAATPTPDKH